MRDTNSSTRPTVVASALSCLLATTALGNLSFAQSQESSRAREVLPPADQVAANQAGGARVVVRDDTRSKAALQPAEIERLIADVSARVLPALVRVSWVDGPRRNNCTGVIVSPEGHVLLRDFPANANFTFDLFDGRRVLGFALGYSGEWGVGVARMTAPGPWRHVELRGALGVKAGQPVVTFAHSRQDPISRALPGLEWVSHSANDDWFMTANVAPTAWKVAGVAFDLDGRLAGLETVRPLGMAVCTDAKRIESLWTDLAAGKNLDQVRLNDQARVPAGDRPANGVISKEGQEKAKAASVRIREPQDAKGFSGVIITEDGLVATCAHRFIMPGGRILVGLPDGRDVVAEMLGIGLPCDIALARITEPGPFPHVELGDSLGMQPGDPCLAIGYGPVDNADRQPLVRTASILAPPDGQWSHELISNAEITGGDSGGGLFDRYGRLMGILHGGGNGNLTSHRRVELFRKHWDQLHAPVQQSHASELASAENAVRQKAVQARRSVVEVLDGDKPVALGTIVSADGRILTKSSVLPESPRVRLHDGRVLACTVLKTLRPDDIAILQVDVTGLAAVEWSDQTNPADGALTAVVAAGGHSAIGIVSSSMHSMPIENGNLRAVLEDGTSGLEVAAIQNYHTGPRFVVLGPQFLQKGDVILSIDGRPTPNREAYIDLLGMQTKDPIAVAGDRVRISIRREGREMVVNQELAPPSSPRVAGQSVRSSGFARVFSVAVSGESNLCGGPVTDREGRAIGVVIASRNSGWLLVLPAELVRNAASQ